MAICTSSNGETEWSTRQRVAITHRVTQSTALLAFMHKPGQSTRGRRFATGLSWLLPPRCYDDGLESFRDCRDVLQNGSRDAYIRRDEKDASSEVSNISQGGGPRLEDTTRLRKIL